MVNRAVSPELNIVILSCFTSISPSLPFNCILLLSDAAVEPDTTILLPAESRIIPAFTSVFEPDNLWNISSVNFQPAISFLFLQA